MNSQNYSNNLFVVFIVAIIIFLIAGWVVQVTWNYVIPQATNNSWRAMTYGQALVLLILVTLLVGSIWNRCVNIITPQTK